jgi:uncharacterized protein YbjT (DUF2867 family)
MSDKKVIAVVGATGHQGGGLVRAILADPDGGYTVRALTRDVTSARAQELAKLGAEVVQADNNDPASLEKAFAGAYGAFLVTNFWTHMDAAKEKQEAANLAAAVRKTGVEHVIWSTLEDTREHFGANPSVPTPQADYTVPHFDAKAEADEYFADLPTTYLRTTAYWENFINFGWEPVRGEDGVLAFVLPLADNRMAGIAAEDIGRTAYGIFKAGRDQVARIVHIAGEHTTGTEIADALAAVLGETVVYRPMSVDAYRALGFPGADELGNMLQYYAEAADYFTGVRDLDEVRRLNPDTQTLAAWLAEHADAIPRH